MNPAEGEVCRPRPPLGPVTPTAVSKDLLGGRGLACPTCCLPSRSSCWAARAADAASHSSRAQTPRGRARCRAEPSPGAPGRILAMRRAPPWPVIHPLCACPAAPGAVPPGPRVGRTEEDPQRSTGHRAGPTELRCPSAVPRAGSLLPRRHPGGERLPSRPTMGLLL